MATKAEVRNIAAGLLGKRRLGQGINDAIKTRLDQSYAYVYAQLKEDKLAIWSIDDNATIPDKVATHVASLMAFEATSDIAVSTERYNRIVTKSGIATFRIKTNVTPPYESLDDTEDF